MSKLYILTAEISVDWIKEISSQLSLPILRSWLVVSVDGGLESHRSTSQMTGCGGGSGCGDGGGGGGGGGGDDEDENAP